MGKKKQDRVGDFRSKIDPYHPSLIDEGEETRIFVTAHKRKREKRSL